MTTKTTDNAQPIEQAAPMMGPVLAPPDLESRIKTRRDEIKARLVELEADARIEAVEARDKLKAKLSELGHIIKEGVVDGWASIGDVVKQKLDHWLAN
jgi:hypothetical protein